MVYSVCHFLLPWQNLLEPLVHNYRLLEQLLNCVGLRMFTVVTDVFPLPLPPHDSSVCVESKLFRNVVYFYCSAEILESVASCKEFVYGKSAPIVNVS